MACILLGVSVPEMANDFKRCGIQFHQVTGMLLNDQECWREIENWVDAAKVAGKLFVNRLGCMGHYYSGMLDIYTDLTQFYSHFGGHIEMIEVEELAALRKTVSERDVKERLRLFDDAFEIQSGCSPEELKEGCHHIAGT